MRKLFQPKFFILVMKELPSRHSSNFVKNVKKHCFLTLFAKRRAKSSKIAVLRIFCELCIKCLEKREKHCFLTLFAERRAKSSKNAVFRFFCELCTKCFEKRGKKVFSYIFRGKPRKKLKKRCFLHFLRTS